MGRIVSSNVLNALNKVSGVKANMRITVFNNRNYFDTFDRSSGSPNYAQAAGITNTPIPQTSAYDSINSRLYTFYTNPTNGKIEITTSGSDIVAQAYASGNPLLSPTWCKLGVYFPYLYRVDTSGNLRVSTIDMTMLKTNFTSGPIPCITSESIIENLAFESYSAFCAVGDLEFVRIFLDDGGIGISHYKYTSGSWVKSTYSHRFMIPDQVLDYVSENGYLLNFFTAIKRTDGIWVYLSYPSGEVKGIHRDTSGVWSDIFISIPQDLSTFRIMNSFLDSKERIHMAGQFQRVDETGAFASDSVWNLLTSSDDGKAFSMDRNSLFSMLGYQFSVIPAGNYLYYIDANRWTYLKATYNSIYEDADSLLLKSQLTSIDGSQDNGYSIGITTVNDALLDHPLLKEGNIAKFEVGINTSGSYMDYILYDTCIISGLTTELANAQRGLTLDILSAGIYKLQQFSYPFYLELQGKQSEFDPISDLSNLYKAPLSSGIREKFAVDFWGNEDRFQGGGLSSQFHNTSGSDLIMSTDLKDYLYLTDYPIIDTLPLTFKIFGWDRIGLQTGADPFNDTTPATNPNDDWVAIIKVQHIDETEQTITLTKEEANNGISWFPQTWKEGSSRLATGVYPIVYSIGATHGLVLGDKVMEVGVGISSSSATVYYPERIEIPELYMYIDSNALSQNNPKISDLTGYDPILADGVDEEKFSSNVGKKGLIIENLGVSNVYFSSKPYTAFNFEVSCKIHIQGTYSYGGLVGLAEDGQNFICGRYKSGLLEITKVRNGVTTILASGSYSTNNVFVRLMFTHEDGDLSIRVQENGVWGNPKLTYRWKLTDGPMTTDNDLFHVGTFSLVDVPKFRICSFDATQCQYLPILPGYDITALNNFPASGTLKIDDVLYSYTGKSITGTIPRGPYQVRCLFNHGSYHDPSDGQYYSGNSIEFTLFEWKNDTVSHLLFKDLIAMSNQGYGWKIKDTEFRTWITTGGVVVELLDRSRYFCDGLSMNSLISCSDKMYITWGLSGATIFPGYEAQNHAEGTYAYYYEENSKVEFTDFYSSSMEADTSVEDLIKKICGMANVKPIFPGDNVHSSLNLTTSKVQL